VPVPTLETMPLRLTEGRFARLEAIQWWDQTRVRNARVLVIGAGALGNEVLKNLALLGAGHIVVADMDIVELSNLSRSVLFRETDEGRSKAECAAARAREIYPELDITAIHGNVLADLGMGYFRWADIVIAALDNREARVFVNSACARVGRPWVDGGIEALQGIARGFYAPATACYECTMSELDWDLLNKRRSCSLLARHALAQAGTPTTPTTASVIAAVQVQEVIKHLHGMASLMGRGFIYEGLGHNSYVVSYPINPACPWHEPEAPIETIAKFDSGTSLKVIWDFAAGRIGTMDALDFSRELVDRVGCPACGHQEPVFQPVEKITEAQARCPRCGTEGQPGFVHSVGAESELLDKSSRELGLPHWDIVWARAGERSLGIELAGDNPFVKAGKPELLNTHVLA
jgi:molybdopterin/thiamine biosynthesis adenylyltransferase